jgi:hypothetical protein
LVIKKDYFSHSVLTVTFKIFLGFCSIRFYWHDSLSWWFLLKRVHSSRTFQPSTSLLPHSTCFDVEIKMYCTLEILNSKIWEKYEKIFFAIYETLWNPPTFSPLNVSLIASEKIIINFFLHAFRPLDIFTYRMSHHKNVEEVFIIIGRGCSIWESFLDSARTKFSWWCIKY